MEIQRLPLNIHTLYQQLLEQSMDDALSRSIGNLKGIFVSKQVKGHTYWYLQYRAAGKQKQAYLGPNSSTLQKAMARWRKTRTKAEEAAAERRRLCAMLRQGGVPSLDPSTGKILGLMVNSGVFHLGAVLVGTHAFQAYATMLGIQWKQGLIRTFDLDLAQNPNLAVAVSPDIGADLPSLLEQAEMGFIPIPALNPKYPSTSFKIAGREIKLDLLAPLIGRERGRPISLPALKTYATPLRFLDYLIEDTLPSTLISGDGLLVNVPQPARFAWHKLIIHSKRPISERAKQKKDLIQAAQLLSVLVDDRPGDLQIGWEALAQRGKGWIEHAKRGLRKIEDSELLYRVSDLLSEKNRN